MRVECVTHVYRVRISEVIERPGRKRGEEPGGGDRRTLSDRRCRYRYSHSSYTSHPYRSTITRSLIGSRQPGDRYRCERLFNWPFLTDDFNERSRKQPQQRANDDRLFPISERRLFVDQRLFARGRFTIARWHARMSTRNHRAVLDRVRVNAELEHRDISTVFSRPEWSAEKPS